MRVTGDCERDGRGLREHQSEAEVHASASNR